MSEPEPRTSWTQAGAEDSRVSRPLLEVDALTKLFVLRRGWFGRRVWLRAVDTVSFHLRRGETLGLVGESGCGKTTLARSILRLTEPSFGRIVFDGQDITPLSQSELRPLRRRMQLVFQDPYSSLDPRCTVEALVSEGLRIHRLVRSRSEQRARVAELLARVGLHHEILERYPHQLSGGQRQRIAIARALATEPEFLVCDEPLSSLDASVQAQVLDLLIELQEQRQLSYLFICHDLRVVGQISHRVAVMYLGRLIELAPTRSLYQNRYHPYTRALWSAVPVPQRQRLRILLEGEPPSPTEPPVGCVFSPRCPRCLPEPCRRQVPVLRELVPGSRHWVACFNPHG